jgi:hypothetical protein
MKMYPDGTLEDTPEEIAAYQRARVCAACPLQPAPQTPPDGWAPTPGVWPPNGAVCVPTVWLSPASNTCAACDPRLGGSGVCGCVRPERDGVRC